MRDLVGKAVEETRLAGEAITVQSGVLKEVSETVLRDAARFVDRIDGQADEMRAIALGLVEANRTVETAVDDRRRTLEALALDISAKTEAVDTMLAAFSELVHKTLSEAETRARTVAQTLATT
ncbi:hypothetical protein J8J27_23185, partial [Mycobacterium tuberculosis]|nr:hypothetical protein [Mycobacterium tuberculosis]